MNKWQVREVAQYAKDNGVTEAEAVEALHPEAKPEPRKLATGKAGASTGKPDADDKSKAGASA